MLFGAFFSFSIGKHAQTWKNPAVGTWYLQHAFRRKAHYGDHVEKEMNWSDFVTISWLLITEPLA